MEPITLKCLLPVLPCITERLQGPLAEKICKILNEGAAIFSDASQEILQKLNASLSPNPSISSTPNIRSGTPGCKVDVVAQAAAASDALKRIKKISKVIEESLKFANDVIQEVVEKVISCAPLNLLLTPLFQFLELTSKCDQASAATAELTVQLEDNLNFYLNYLNTAFNFSLESIKILQIFTNLGLCNGQLNVDGVLTIKNGLVIGSTSNLITV